MTEEPTTYDVQLIVITNETNALALMHLLDTILKRNRIEGTFVSITGFQRSGDKK